MTVAVRLAAIDWLGVGRAPRLNDAVRGDDACGFSTFLARSHLDLQPPTRRNSARAACPNPAAEKGTQFQPSLFNANKGSQKFVGVTPDQWIKVNLPDYIAVRDDKAHTFTRRESKFP